MIKSKSKPDNYLDEVDYSFPKIGKAKLIPILLSVFFLAFVLNFPLFEIIDTKLKDTLARIPGCPLAVKDINFGVLLPRVELVNLNIPARCTGGKEINLDKLSLYFRGPSFSPLGLSTKIETNFKNIPVEAYLALGLKTQAIKLDDFKLDLKELNSIAPDVKIAGHVLVNALIEIQNNKLNKVNALVESKDFSLPTQNIQGFTVPPMNIKSFSLQLAQDSGKKMILKQLVLGDLDSPIRANFTGDIYPNSSNFLFSRIDLKGELALGDQLMQDFSIITSFLNAFSRKDKFYQMRLQGTIGQPIPKPL